LAATKQYNLKFHGNLMLARKQTALCTLICAHQLTNKWSKQ